MSELFVASEWLLNYVNSWNLNSVRTHEQKKIVTSNYSWPRFQWTKKIRSHVYCQTKPTKQPFIVHIPSIKIISCAWCEMYTRKRKHINTRIIYWKFTKYIKKDTTKMKKNAFTYQCNVKKNKFTYGVLKNG